VTKRNVALTVLFFGSVWGLAEAALGGLLYRADVPPAAAPLAVTALAVFTVARVVCPRPGLSTLIAACAMLFKFANAPFWACHLLGIFLLGVAYDVVLLAAGREWLGAGRRALKNALVGAGSAYLGFALFAVLITYVFRYEYWARDGLPRVLSHVGIGGTLAAAGAAIAVPLAARLGETLASRPLALLPRRATLATGGLWLVTAGLWIVAVAVPF